MRAIAKYFWVVGGLLLAQMAVGVVTAHYGVEGTAFYDIPLAEWVPYSLARTWHVQLDIFWIATGLCLPPIIAGREPRFQHAGVNGLFAALVLVVAGSIAGQSFAIHQRLGTHLNFWIGHQGYEYVDLGRLWQILLFAGLLLWLTTNRRRPSFACGCAPPCVSRQLLRHVLQHPGPRVLSSPRHRAARISRLAPYARLLQARRRTLSLPPARLVQRKSPGRV